MAKAARVDRPIFVSAKTGAGLCEVGVDKWREWQMRGMIPPPVVNDGQIVRWYWPAVEDALASTTPLREIDPSVQGVRNVHSKGSRRAAS